MEHEPFIADIVPTKCFFILYLHILLHYITWPEGNPPQKKNTTDSVTKLQTINDLDQWPDVASGQLPSESHGIHRHLQNPIAQCQLL